jgi:predicted transcriptional regulator
MEKDVTKFKDFNLMVTIIREFDEPKVVASVARKLKVNDKTVYRALNGLEAQGFKVERIKQKDGWAVKHHVVDYPESFKDIIMELARKIMWGKKPTKENASVNPEPNNQLIK